MVWNLITGERLRLTEPMKPLLGFPFWSLVSFNRLVSESSSRRETMQLQSPRWWAGLLKRKGTKRASFVEEISFAKKQSANSMLNNKRFSWQHDGENRPKNFLRIHLDKNSQLILFFQVPLTRNWQKLPANRKSRGVITRHPKFGFQTSLANS